MISDYKFTIITPTLNSSDHIQKALESLKSQTYKNIEHIIVDGCSKDGTLEILKNYAEKIKDYTVKIISEPDKGVYDALNKGIRLSTGDIVGVLHSDDEYADEHILDVVANAFRNTKADACYGDIVYVDRKNRDKIVRYWKAKEYKTEDIRKGFMPPHTSLFVKKNIYQIYGLYDTAYCISGDYEMLLRILWKHSISVVYIPKILVKMKTGGKSGNSLKKLFRKILEDYKALSNNKVPNPFIAVIYKRILKINQFKFLSVKKITLALQIDLLY